VLQLGGAAVISSKRELAMWLAQVLCDVVRPLYTSTEHQQVHLRLVARMTSGVGT
jgi:hypothetical protein